MPLLDVRNLSIRFPARVGTVAAVDGVSFAVAEGETLALVGESGCGKTLTALAVLRPDAAGRFGCRRRHRSARPRVDRPQRAANAPVRGKEVGFVFQDPLTALYPVWSVGEQVAEGLRLHEGLGRREAWERAVEALREVGIADPRRRASEYPHQLSGGMRQRAMIAAALACRPPLLIADEPTTAARRDLASADHRPAAAAARGASAVDPAHHTRSWGGGGIGSPRRRDVRRPGRGVSGGGHAVPTPLASVHTGAALGRTASGPWQWTAPDDHRRSSTGPDALSTRLSLRPTLSACAGGMPASSGTSRIGAEASGPLLPHRRVDAMTRGA